MLSCLTLATALALLPVPPRPEALLPLLDSADPLIYAAAVDGLARGGPAAVPVLRQLLADDFRPDRYRFLDPLVQAAGTSRVAELERLLGEELAFWHNLGLNVDEQAKVPQPRLHFLVALLGHLDRLGYRDESGLVRAVRDQFRDHPLLGRQSPVVPVADTILARP